MCAIDCQAARLFAWCDRPAMCDGQVLRVDVDDLILVFDVDEHVSGAVALAELRLAAEGDGGDGFAVGVEHGCILAAAVEREDVLRGRIVQNSVWIIATRLHFINRS